MIATWMLYTLLVGGLIVAAAHACHSLLRLLGRPVRWVWAGTILAVVAIPLLTALRPAPGAPATPEAVVESVALVKPILAPVTAGLTTLPAARSLDRPLLVAWGATSLILLAALLHSVGVLRGRRREWPQASVNGRRVLVAGDVGPAVVGWRGMQVVVPAWVLALDEEARGLILAHEEEHIRTRDPQLMLGGLLMAMVMPWNLPLWYAWRRLRLAIELDCDARVLATGVNRRAYGETLLEASSRVSHTDLPALATFAERSGQLEERLSALAPAPVRRRTVRLAGAGLAAAALLTVACTMDNPLGIDLAEGELPAKIRISNEVAWADNPAMVRMLVRRFAEHRSRNTLEAGRAPESFIAVLVFDPQRRIVRVGARSSTGTQEDEISLGDLGGEQIESIEVIKGRAVGVDNVEGVILIQLGEPREMAVRNLPGRRQTSATEVEVGPPKPSVVVRTRNP